MNFYEKSLQPEGMLTTIMQMFSKQYNQIITQWARVVCRLKIAKYLEKNYVMGKTVRLVFDFKHNASYKHNNLL